MSNLANILLVVLILLLIGVSQLATDNKITIYIVEDYLLIRKSLKHIIGKAEEFDVISDFETAEEFIDVFKSKPSDVVIMDLGLPKMNGLQATKLVKELSPDTKVIILTSHENDDEVLAALAVGANAYCLKEIESFLIHSIIRDVYKGALWLYPQVADVPHLIAPKPCSMDLDNLYNRSVLALKLTEREMTVLKLIVDGKTNNEIADAMSISTHTAKAHVGSILEKLSVDDRVQAAVKAVRTKIVE